ncbi:translation initiation factor IF-2 [Rickettsia endosymbiont of Orchestes rusci]|uniref:translation initiation factor IF-2 n=1 Tax=Rickettsia endosymbiont of Orchestes rusci TaxID=3066250 RepID=UPI00313DC100
MTNNQEIKPKKLTLGNSKLSLNKPIESLSGPQSFVNSKSRTLVEVRKSTVTCGTLSLGKEKNNSNQNLESTNEEFNRRLSILKKAAEQARSNENAPISTLSRLASMNQATIQKEESPEDLPPENDTEPVRFEETQEDATTTNADLQKPEKKVEAFVKSPLIGVRSRFGIESESDIGREKLTEGKIVAPKIKIEEPKKLKKTDIFNMLGEDGGDLGGKTRSLASIKRARDKEKRKAQQQQPEKIYREVTIPEVISISDLASGMSERAVDVIKELMKLGILANTSQMIDADTAELVATNLGHTVKRVQESDIENILINKNEKDEDLKPRAPIVTVMGHVDHGKTSLLDALKSTDIAAQETGGITQHIGAYRVTLEGGKAITFIDTPGHEAFSEMRGRGAQVTDIVIIVVAADDGIKTQTIEAINHAKAAHVPIIVAINKIDKPDIDIEKVKNELFVHEIISDETGGDVMVIPVSALKKINLDKLEEAILLVAEMQDLKANPVGAAAGVVIESRVEKGKGIVATILVQQGNLKNGDIIIAGTSYGKVKRMNNDKGLEIHSALPSVPVEVYGLNEVPHAGDKFNVVQNEKQAKDIVEYRTRIVKERKISIAPRSSLEELFLKAAGTGKIKELPVIIKGDVHGSVEAISGSLLKLPNDEVKLRVLHSGVGPITESDITLAQASKAIVLGFNVRAGNNATAMAEKEKVEIRYYSIIYDLLDDIKAIMSGMLDPIIREQYIGSVEIRQVFNVSKVGKIAGSYVTKGVIKKGAGVRLLRDNVVIHEGKLKTLKRFKEEVKEVRENFECGIAFEHYEDIKEGDVVEVFELIEEKKQL